MNDPNFLCNEDGIGKLPGQMPGHEGTRRRERRREGGTNIHVAAVRWHVGETRLLL